MAAIDIGNSAEARPGAWSATYTRINKANPANLSGKITLIQIYAHTEIANFEVGIFQQVSADTFTTRSVSGNLGTIPAHTLTEKVVDLDVVAGDYIGCYGTTGSMDGASEAGGGLWYLDGDWIPCTNKAFTLYDTDPDLSLYGIGAEPGWTGKVCGVINPAKVMGIAVANIAKVHGV